MDTEADIARKFWKALEGDRIAMLSLAGVEEGHSQPMSAQLLEEHRERGGPIWFFTSKETELARALGAGHRAQLHFSAKGHELFAAVHGELVPVDDRGVVERLWNRFVAAWFDGKDDPKLRLLRFDADRAQIWLNENSTFAGMRILMGRDPKEGYERKVADVNLGTVPLS